MILSNKNNFKAHDVLFHEESTSKNTNEYPQWTNAMPKANYEISFWKIGNSYASPIRCKRYVLCYTLWTQPRNIKWRIIYLMTFMKHIHEILSSSDKHKNVYKVILQPLDVYDTNITL